MKSKYINWNKGSSNDPFYRIKNLKNLKSGSWHEKHSHKIELSFTETNWYSLNVKIKLWAPHETRNQMKIYYRLTINTNRDNLLIDINSQLLQYPKWYSKNTEMILIQFILPMFYDIKITIPNFIYIKEADIILKQLLDHSSNQKNVIEKIGGEIEKNDLRLKKWLMSKFWKKIFKKRERKLNDNKKILHSAIAIWRKNNITTKNLLNSVQDEKTIFLNAESSTNEFDEKMKNENTLDFLEIKKFLKEYHINKRIFKGIYIIFNKTKMKYYVGQSKNVFERVCLQHFKNGVCENKHFKDDYNNNDLFYIRTIECETKDELDRLEKKYINKFDSFRSGYNKTGGNK